VHNYKRLTYMYNARAPAARRAGARACKSQCCDTEYFFNT